MIADSKAGLPHAAPPDPFREVVLHTERCCASTIRLTSDVAAGSRRRRLWELGPHSHCPVIGVCLPLAAMRRLARKVLGGEPLVDDYELHCGMVADCKQRSPMAKAVQRELDRRFMLALRRAAAVKTAQGLADWWQEQGSSKDLPAALWATLSHPRCTPALEHQVLGQVHMIQHQVGMATRVDLGRFEALIDENAILTRELARAQQRCTRQMADHANTTQALQADLVRMRGQTLAAQSLAGSLRDELQSVRESLPGLDSRLALSDRNSQQTERITGLRRALNEAHGEIERLREQIEQAAMSALPSPPALPTPDLPAKPSPALASAGQLKRRSVLCVGGRTASVPVYRRLVEGRGARFLHHDGGEEHGAAQLESTLSAADLVICQAGCISHNAYWRVKDHCKRFGKQCVFVETPSASSLQRALVDIGSGE